MPTSDSPPLDASIAARSRWSRPPATRLSIEIWLHRHGWALPLAAMLAIMAGALLLTEVLPGQRKNDLLRSDLQALQSRPIGAPAKPAIAEMTAPGQALRDLLGQAERAPEQVRRIAGIARSHGIELPRAQYNTTRQSPSGIDQTTITFRFISRYPQARSFVEEVLRQLPNASVERLSLEREQAQGPQAEVTLQLTLWHWPSGASKMASR